MKYRSRTDIVLQILQAAESETTKTRIMYEVFLSYAQLKDYLNTLVENGLLEFSEPKKKYRTTAKGLQVIASCHKLNDLSSGSLSA